MADLLLELFSEEIPARMQAEAADGLEYRLLNELHINGYFKDDLYDKGIKSVARSLFSSPRRLAVIIKDLPLKQENVSVELKGPKVGAPQAAIEGFLKKNGLARADLVEREGVYFATLKKEGRKTADVLKAAIEKILTEFPWPKSMRWGGGEARWVRPLHSILCLFDGKIVPVEFAGLKAGSVTYGHRFLAPEAITITNPDEYEERLRKAYVIADRDKRKTEILHQAEKTAAAHQLSLKKDNGLLEEVTGLVEWPVVLTGKIDPQFMNLPPEVLVSEMRGHQKYFALTQPSPCKGEGQGGGDALAPYFLITCNMQTPDGGKAVIAGNERVLRARLSDGRFFWDQDRRKRLEEWGKGLAAVTFHAKLGTVAEKVERVKQLAAQIAEQWELDARSAGRASLERHPMRFAGANRGDSFKEQVTRAAALCKADLVTGMVGEFPELQGVMGRYYALHQGEDAAVADAIRDHYKPLGPNDAVPTAPVSVCVALADKLDTLASMFSIGEKPTGSKDPFALRRAALGVIRIILENGLRISLANLILSKKALYRDILNEASHDLFHEDLYPKTKRVFVRIRGIEDNFGDDIPKEDAPIFLVAYSLLNFLSDRLKVQLKDSGIRHDVINAVVADGDDDLVRIVARAKALQDFLSTDDGANLLAAYKRAANILAIEEKKDKTSYRNKLPEPGKFLVQEERDLNQAISHTIQASGGVKECLAEERFTDAMRVLSRLRAPVDAFFDKVLVNDSDNAVRVNRLRLLSQFRDGLNEIADFSKIEG